MLWLEDLYGLSGKHLSCNRSGSAVIEVDLSQVALQASSESAEMCVVCSQQHPSGLRIRYGVAEDGSVVARWIPTAEWGGFPGLIHGGVLSTVLDEAMSKAIASTGVRALTAELRVRFREEVAPGEELFIKGWIVTRNRRLFRTEATLRAASGAERVHAWAAFLVRSKRLLPGRIGKRAQIVAPSALDAGQ